jgi:hypothetical protein
VALFEGEADVALHWIPRLRYNPSIYGIRFVDGLRPLHRNRGRNSSPAPTAARCCPSCGATIVSDSGLTAGVTLHNPLPAPSPVRKPASKAHTSSSGLSNEGRFLLGALLAGRYRSCSASEVTYHSTYTQLGQFSLVFENRDF